MQPTIGSSLSCPDLKRTTKNSSTQAASQQAEEVETGKLNSPRKRLLKPSSFKTRTSFPTSNRVLQG